MYFCMNKNASSYKYVPVPRHPNTARKGDFRISYIDDFLTLVNWVTTYITLNKAGFRRTNAVVGASFVFGSERRKYGQMKIRA